MDKPKPILYGTGPKTGPPTWDDHRADQDADRQNAVDYSHRRSEEDPRVSAARRLRLGRLSMGRWTVESTGGFLIPLWALFGSATWRDVPTGHRRRFATTRRDGSLLNRWVIVVGSAIGFFIAAGYIGVLDVF